MMARGKRVELVKIMVDGAEVDAKACTKCGDVKALTDFQRKQSMSCGRQPLCRTCKTKTGRGNVQRNKWTAEEAMF